MNARMSAAALAALLLAIPMTARAQSGDAQAPTPTASGSGRGWSQTTPEPARAPHASGPVRFDVDQRTPSGQVAAPSSGTTTPQPPAMTVPSRRRGPLQNVKVEFMISDQIGTKPPTRKTMIMVVADSESSRIRTTAPYKITRPDGGVTWGRAPLSVDLSPWVEGNKIRVEFSIEYGAVDEAVTTGATGEATVSERLVAVVESGVPLVVAQSSDAVSDRKVTVEIKATIMK